MPVACLEFFPLSPDRPGPVVPNGTLHRGLPHVNNKPTYLSRDGLEKLRHELDEMVRKRPRSPIGSTTQGAGDLPRTPVRTPRTSRRSSRAGSDARGDHQERHDHRREPFDDHVQIGSTVSVEARTARDVHDRQVRGGQPRKPDLERRSNARWRKKKRQGRGEGCPLAASPTGSSASPTRRAHGLGGRTAARVRDGDPR